MTVINSRSFYRSGRSLEMAARAIYIYVFISFDFSDDLNMLQFAPRKEKSWLVARPLVHIYIYIYIYI